MSRGTLREDGITGKPIDCRLWWATDADFPWVQYLLRRFRNYEFFYAPDETMKAAIRLRNILCFDYNRLEAGYIWATFVQRKGRCRFNHVAITEELWRNGVGRYVVSAVESKAALMGLWGAYLSCNSNTPGHRFWPALGYSPIIEKAAGRSRGGVNIIWAKILGNHRNLFGPMSPADVKSSYVFQYSMNDGGHSIEVPFISTQGVLAL